MSLSLRSVISNITRQGIQADATEADIRRHQAGILIILMAMILIATDIITLHFLHVNTTLSIKVTNVCAYVVALFLYRRGHTFIGAYIAIGIANLAIYVASIEDGKNSLTVVCFLTTTISPFIFFSLRQWRWIAFSVFWSWFFAVLTLVYNYQLPPALAWLGIITSTKPTDVVSIVTLSITIFFVAGTTLFLVFLNDHSEQVAWQQVHAAKNNERRLTSVLSSVTDPIWITDINLKVVMANAAFHTVYKARYGREYDKESIDEIPNLPEEEVLWKPRYADAIKGKTEEFYNSFVGVDGQRVWEAVTLTPLKLNDSISGVVGIARNITAVKEADASISATAMQLQALVASLDDIVCQVNRTGFVLAVWASHHSPLSEFAKSLQGKHIRLLADDAGAAMMNAINNTFITQRPHSIEYYLQRVRRWYQAKLSYVTENNSVTILLADVSDRKANDEHIQGLNNQLQELNALYSEANRNLADNNAQLEQRVSERTAELQRMTEQLQEENGIRKHTEERLSRALQREQSFSDMKSRFVTMLSHQFRTPLTLVQNGLDIITSLLIRNTSISHEQVAKHLSSMMGATDQIVELLERVATLSDMQINLLEEKPHQFVLEPLLRTIIHECAMQDENNVVKPLERIQVRLQGDIPSLYTIETALHRALMEVVKNALHYSDENSPIVISAEVDRIHSHRVHITVTNQGKQLSEEEYRMIFENFYRTGLAQTVGSQRGLGIGLGIAQFCMQTLNGIIVCTNSESNLTHFHLEFPAVLPQ